MSGLWYVVWEGMRAGLRRSGMLAAWAASFALLAVAGTALLVLPGEQGGEGPSTETILIATLSPLLSENDISALGGEIWGWEGVAQVAFRFPGENDPIPIEERSLVIRLADEGARLAVQEQLASLNGIVGISFLERTRIPLPGLPSIARILALVGLVVAVGLNLWLGRRAIGEAVTEFGEELALLKSAGISVTWQRAPFLALGIVAGLGGALIYIGCYWVVWSWARGVPGIRSVVPAFFTGGALATGLGILVGIVLGALGGAVWYSPLLVAQRLHRAEPRRPQGGEDSREDTYTRSEQE